MELFKIENLTYYYPATRKPALWDVNLSIEEGEFLLAVGGSGSGKSSFARLLAGLIPGYYGGQIGGRLYYRGLEVLKGKGKIPAGEVGIVFQDPEKQLVMAEVEAEIAFGLENLNLELEEMKRRVAEVAGFLGLSSFLGQPAAVLSGGQKQKLALASVLAMHPHVLVLDEPTSQLDPASAEEFFNLVRRLNEEMGMTVVLIEQRLERCYHLADRVVLFDGGRCLAQGTPEEVACWQVENGFPFLPPVTSLFVHLGFCRPPLTVKEGKRFLATLMADREERKETGSETVLGNPFPKTSVPNNPAQKNFAPGNSTPENNAFGDQAPGNNASGNNAPGELILEMSKVWFSYPGSQREALRGVTLSMRRGEIIAVLGENAAGKTTLLKLAAGLLKPDRGQVLLAGADSRRFAPYQLAGMVGYLSQNPGEHLLQETVEEEVFFTLLNLGRKADEKATALLQELELEEYRYAHPRDLSSGERQRAALAAVLAAEPRILLLDEPTRGLDRRLKVRLGNLLRRLAARGIAVLLVTHDVEFAAEYAQRAAMLFEGRVVAEGTVSKVLPNSMFYAPQVSRLLRGSGMERGEKASAVTFQEAFAYLSRTLNLKGKQ